MFVLLGDFLFTDSTRGFPEHHFSKLTIFSHEKRAPGWLFDIGDEILPNCMGIIIGHYKDPY